MEELPGGRGSRCVASRRRIEAPAAIHVLAYHPTSSMPSCRIDGMRSSKGADRLQILRVHRFHFHVILPRASRK